MKTPAPRNKNKGQLRNPAVIAAAVSPAGRRAAEKGVDLFFTVLKVGFFCAAGYFVYTKFVKTFKKAGEASNLPAANVTDVQAGARASALYTAMYGFSNDFEAVKQALAGLNYNGWIKVFNAFAYQQPWNPLADKMNLIEWLGSEFDKDEMNELRIILPGVF